MFTVFPEGAKAVIDFDWNGVGVSVALHFELSSPTESDYVDLAAAVAAEWATEIMPAQSEELIMGDVTVYDLSAEDAPKFVNSDESSTIGGIAGDGVPNNTAPIVSHRTTALGRSGRGRTYVPGLVETNESDGLLVAAAQTALALAWADFITAVQVTGWAFVVAQRFSEGAQLVTGVMRPVVTEILKRQLGTQRRRQVPSAV